MTRGAQELPYNPFFGSPTRKAHEQAGRARARLEAAESKGKPSNLIKKLLSRLNAAEDTVKAVQENF